ncbi:MAG: sugar transferase [Caldilineaceae bacterium]
MYIALLVVADALMLALAFTLAYWLRFQVGITISPDVAPSIEKYLQLVAILLPFWLFVFMLYRLYDINLLLGGTSEYSRAFNASTACMMLVVLVSFTDERFVIARGWLAMSWILASFFVCLARLGLRHSAYFLRRSQNYFVTPAIIVGSNKEALALAEQLRQTAYSGLKIMGYIEAHDGEDVGKILSHDFGLPKLGTLNTLPDAVAQLDVREVIVASTALSRPQLLELFQTLVKWPKVEMRLSSGLYEAMTTNMKVNVVGAVPLMSLNRLRIHGLESIWKRLLDWAVIVAASPLLIPLFGLIALLVKLDSPGPVIYRRRVLGVGGVQFDAFKFRTMVTNGDEILAQHPWLALELAANHKLRNDPRITRVGKWLRMTSLDELPQLINVLLGQMSLVGPRMISPEEAKEYGIMSSNLLTVKPGLTGLWQVSGRSNLSYDERVKLDMHYIRNYSIWLDLQILCIQTLPAVLKGRGAY